jgi:hypothetical protein
VLAKALLDLLVQRGAARAFNVQQNLRSGNWLGRIAYNWTLLLGQLSRNLSSWTRSTSSAAAWRG